MIDCSMQSWCCCVASIMEKEICSGYWCMIRTEGQDSQTTWLTNRSTGVNVRLKRKYFIVGLFTCCFSENFTGVMPYTVGSIWIVCRLPRFVLFSCTSFENSAIQSVQYIFLYCMGSRSQSSNYQSTVLHWSLFVITIFNAWSCDQISMANRYLIYNRIDFVIRLTRYFWECGVMVCVVCFLFS